MTEYKQYTRADVAKRSGRNGEPSWIIYKDVIYDVTHYVREHPGGDVITEEVGKDGTKAFDSIGHSSDAHTVMSKLKVGEIVDEEKWYDSNGKKRKVVLSADDSEEGGRSCLSLCTCGLL